VKHDFPQGVLTVTNPPTASSSSRYAGNIAEHPDLAEMRERYERISSTPRAVVVDGLVLLAGLWLAISPWVIHFNNTAPDLRVNNLVLGIAVAVVALGLATQPSLMARLSWATAVIGAWVIVSPWVVQRSGLNAGIILNNLITGAIILLLGVAAAAMAMGAGPRGRLATSRTTGRATPMSRP
jgi:hypothetical protein